MHLWQLCRPETGLIDQEAIAPVKNEFNMVIKINHINTDLFGSELWKIVVVCGKTSTIHFQLVNKKQLCHS